MSLASTALKSAGTAAAPWLEMVKPFWPLIWRAALAAAIFFAGWHYGGKSAEAQLDQFKADQAMATANAVQQLADDLADRTREMTKTEVANVQTINNLKAQQAAAPVPHVRVCAPARPRTVPGVPGHPGTAETDTGGGGELSGGVAEDSGVDIGPAVQSLVNRAEIVRTKCLQNEARAHYLATQKPVTIPVK